ncbi:hypothetical protein BBK82_07280 [Lentzea guizhouensis]|uniref:Uncharacterized protein n=1 Tax=Lentzea guizhouensis TaxID=1586287 RepID=A0A1B2HDV4_9PSEU|nr:hypothetical protein [Lentzea guizhouensis]ANZ35914.1 hypothetical protein BBK82_07280 [Lentzea guizhouensis]
MAADHTEVPAWARFFTDTDLSAVVGAVHTDLALTVHPRHTRTAIPLLAEAVDDYGDDMTRSRAFSLIRLSINHLLDGDADRGVAVGFRALEAAEPFTSARVRDRIRPLGKRPQQYQSHVGGHELFPRACQHTIAATPTRSSSKQPSLDRHHLELVCEPVGRVMAEGE